MKFLLDQDVYAITAIFLAGLGHEVVRAAEIGLSQASDEDLLAISRRQGRIFVTRDRDFGGLIFVRRLGGGVIYLRMLPSNQKLVHAELQRVLELYSAEEVGQAFIVVGPDGHRKRSSLGK
ncbi:MAG: DUF5615 family PIN-like protein [Chloroflexota bacterium]